MGSRGVIGVLDGGQLRMWYDHWIAQRLPDELLPGWDYFLHRADTGRSINDWLDTRWNEGSVLLDRDRRAMLLFGGEEASYDRGYRGAVVELLAITWPGYDIRWCHEGVLDIIDYLKIDREPYLVDRSAGYLSTDTNWFTGYEGWDPASDGGVTVVSFSSGSRPATHAVADTADWEDFLAGPAAWAEASRYLTYRLEPWYHPTTGAHIDFRAKRLLVWSAWSASGVREDLSKRWPGWHIEYTGDDPTRHELISGLELRRPHDIASTRYREVIARSAKTLATIRPPDIDGIVRALGDGVDVSPYAYDTSVPTRDVVDLARQGLRTLWAQVAPGQALPPELASPSGRAMDEVPGPGGVAQIDVGPAPEQ